MGAAAVPGWLALLAGCGLAANPQPPTLWLPTPVKDLAATRVGDAIHLHWTMPKNTTDKVALMGDQRAHFCWEPATAVFDAKACKAAGDGMFAPDKPADFTAQLPAELHEGNPRAVELVVELRNHAGKSAGPSNVALVASGAAPAGVTGLRLEARAEGVELHWDAGESAAGLTMRMHRSIIPTAGRPTPNAQKPKGDTGASPPEEQVLEVDLDKADPGGAVDHDATLDHHWKYGAERVMKVNLDGHALEIAGAPSATMTIDAKDVFPPAVPVGLTAVADAEAKAMALSWTPDTDADIAGYIVYRQDTTAGTEWQRISGKALVVPSSFSDGNVVAGHRYAYAASAVDQDGNESGRSSPVVEEMPN